MSIIGDRSIAAVKNRLVAASDQYPVKRAYGTIGILESFRFMIFLDKRGGKGADYFILFERKGCPMMRMLVGLFAALLAAPTMAGVTANSGVSAAQAQAVGARIPMVVQLIQAHRVDEARMVVTLRLWSSTHAPVVAAIPSNLIGWSLHGADGRTVSGVHFHTIGHEPYVTTGASGHNVFLLRYDEPVTIPVMIDHDFTRKVSTSLEIAIIACGDSNCVPFHFTFPHARVI